MFNHYLFHVAFAVVIIHVVVVVVVVVVVGVGGGGGGGDEVNCHGLYYCGMLINLG